MAAKLRNGRSLLVGCLMAAVLAAPLARADASSVPTAGSESARATVHDLQSLGYNVQLNWVNGSHDVGLSQCTVDNINTTDRVTAYVDVDCPK
jgi:hypothetical protein